MHALDRAVEPGHRQRGGRARHRGPPAPAGRAHRRRTGARPHPTGPGRPADRPAHPDAQGRVRRRARRGAGQHRPHGLSRVRRAEPSQPALPAAPGGDAARRDAGPRRPLPTGQRVHGCRHQRTRRGESAAGRWAAAHRPVPRGLRRRLQHGAPFTGHRLGRPRLRPGLAGGRHRGRRSRDVRPARCGPPDLRSGPPHHDDQRPRSLLPLGVPAAARRGPAGDESTRTGVAVAGTLDRPAAGPAGAFCGVLLPRRGGGDDAERSGDAGRRCRAPDAALPGAGVEQRYARRGESGVEAALGARRLVGRRPARHLLVRAAPPCEGSRSRRVG